MKIGIAGVGGIGSNVAVHLVRAGCTSLKLVDFDRVEHSNLNRQFYFIDQIGGYKVDMLRENLLRIVPEATIETAKLRLDAWKICWTRSATAGCWWRDLMISNRKNCWWKHLPI